MTVEQKEALLERLAREKDIKGQIKDMDTDEVKKPHVPVDWISTNDSEIIVDKELRRDLDVQLQKLKKLSGSRERSLAITKLQECIMWMGMDLKRLGPDSNPYPSSYDPKTTKVEPTADGLKL